MSKEPSWKRPTREQLTEDRFEAKARRWRKTGQRVVPPLIRNQCTQFFFFYFQDELASRAFWHNQGIETVQRPAAKKQLVFIRWPNKAGTYCAIRCPVETTAAKRAVGWFVWQTINSCPTHTKTALLFVALENYYEKRQNFKNAGVVLMRPGEGHESFEHPQTRVIVSHKNTWDTELVESPGTSLGCVCCIILIEQPLKGGHDWTISVDVMRYRWTIRMSSWPLLWAGMRSVHLS